MYPYLSEMSYFMRRELKICPHNQNSTAIGRPRSIFSLINQDGDGFLMYTKRLSQGRFREVLKKGDDGVHRLQWDDF